MEPLFGPVAGGTNITITGSSPNDHPPSNSGSYVPDVRDVINVYLGNDLSATSVFKVNARLEARHVTYIYNFYAA